MEDQIKIQSVIDRLRSSLVMEVEYDSIKLPVRNIITRMSANRIEAEKKSSEDRMMELLGIMSSSSRDDFEHFLSAAAQANMALRETITKVYFEEFGCHLVLSQVPVRETEPGGGIHIPGVNIRPHAATAQSATAQSATSLSATAPSATGTEDHRHVYKMQSNYPYGLCLIINNETFSDRRIGKREGSDKDVKRMEKLFQRLGFLVDKKENLTANEMKDALKQHASSATRDNSILAVVLMSHGGRHDYVYGSDAVAGDMTNAISRDELMQFFTAINCPNMAGKPKMFIVQACRGNFEDKRNNGNSTQPPPAPSGTPTSLTLENDSIPNDYARPSQTADMCFIYASSPGYVAYRHPQHGSHFVRIFRRYIRKHAATDVYSEIIRKIINKFNRMDIAADTKTLPEYSTTMTKNLYLKLLPQTGDERDESDTSDDSDDNTA